MKFKKLKIQNIRSYDKAEIIFPDGNLLLSGDIGSGKTTILLATEFALFGLQPGQKGTSILKNGKDEGLVELEFEIDGKQIIVKRILKRKKTITQDSTFITIEGEEKEKPITEIKNQILNLINYPKEFTKKTNLLYRFTVYTPQEEMKQIIQENPETRLNTLRQIFGIDKYKKIKENSQILISKLREISRLKQGQILDLEILKSSIQEKKNTLKQTKNQFVSLKKEIQEISSIKTQKESELEKISEKISEKIKLENEIEKTNLLLMTKKEQLIKIENEIKQLQEIVEKVKKNFDPIEFGQILNDLDEKQELNEIKNKELIKLSLKSESLKNKLSELNALNQKILKLNTCPTCMQQVSTMHKNNIFDTTEKEINKIARDTKINQEQIKKIKNQFEESQAQISQLTKRKTELEEIKLRLKLIQNNKTKPEEFEKQKSFLEEDIKILSEQIIRLKNTILELNKFERIFEIKNKELQEIETKLRLNEIQKAQTEKEIELIQEQIKNIEIEIKEKQKIKSEVIYLNELETWISTKFFELISLVESSVMNHLRNEFSELFGRWFSILIPDAFSVKLDDNFTPIIEQQNYQLDYNFLSGGERTAVALAYRLALNQTINSILSEIKTKGLVILDEPTDGFSQTQLNKIRDVLQQLNIEQLIIVSHDQKIESFVDNVIKLKKENGISRVEG